MLQSICKRRFPQVFLAAAETLEVTRRGISSTVTSCSNIVDGDSNQSAKGSSYQRKTLKEQGNARRTRPARSSRYSDRYGSDQVDGRQNKGEDEKKMKTINRVVPMSKDLIDLYKAVMKGDTKGLAKYREKKEVMSDDEILLLADAIEFYFSMAPSTATSVDGLRQADRNALAALAKTIRLYKGSKGRDAAIPKGVPVSSPIEKKVINTAPPGRIPWQALGVNEDIGAIYWGVDLTGGKAADPWSNARLSQATKNLMFEFYKSDPEKYTPARLAELFCIREQRALAILRLKEMAEQDPAAQDPVSQEAAKVMERAMKCNLGIGSGEKHHVTLPSFPAFAQVKQEDVIAQLEKVLGKPVEEITVDEITPDVTKTVFGTKTLEEMEDIVAEREEKHLVEEFKQKLDYNLGITAKSISRDSRRTKAPTRPKEGWNLVVTPIGKESKSKYERYVALPDGTQRKLTEDEQVYIQRKTPKPRRRIL